MKRAPMSEAQLAQSIADLTRSLRIHRVHFRPARVGEPDVDERKVAAASNGYMRAVLQHQAATGGGKQQWRTPVEGDGAGWPDDFYAGHADPRPACPYGCPPPPAVKWRELKGDGGKPSAEQEQWLHWLNVAGADGGIWTPDDLHSGRIEDELRAIAPGRNRRQRATDG